MSFGLSQVGIGLQIIEPEGTRTDFFLRVRSTLGRHRTVTLFEQVAAAAELRGVRVEPVGGIGNPLNRLGVVRQRRLVRAPNRPS